MSQPFILTAITRDPEHAACADVAGVDRIGVDIERVGKVARQGHIPNARISDHELSDLKRLKAVIKHAALFARLNPMHAGSDCEIEDAVAEGATVLMLPYFTGAADVERFVRRVDGRAEIVLLLETAAAVVRLSDILRVAGVAEVMIGLNDLHLSMGLANHFELVVSDVMVLLSDQVRRHGLRFGFGGLARAGDDHLPVPSDLVIAQHLRLHSSSAWLSRSFFAALSSPTDTGAEVQRLRERLAYWSAQPVSALDAERERLRRHFNDKPRA